jgi:hypothetical protein
MILVFQIVLLLYFAVDQLNRSGVGYRDGRDHQGWSAIRPRRLLQVRERSRVTPNPAHLTALTKLSYER